MSNIEEAQQRYNAATTAIKNCPAGKMDGIEQAYSIAYQKLVAAGGATQIRRKYRGR